MKPWRSFPVPIIHAQWHVDLFKERPRVGGDKVQGYCDYKNRRIGLWINPNELALRAAWWHEFFHALLYEMGDENAADEHDFIQSLADGVMCVRTKVEWF